MNPDHQSTKKITAGIKYDSEGKPIMFILSRDNETVTLDPGKTWLRADTFKWVTRGLIEEPQSFHVSADGTIEINGEKIRLHSPQGVTQLEHEINKSHKLESASQQASASSAAPKTKIPTFDIHKIVYRVRIDALGHLLIEAHRGHERVETGLRGLSTFIHNGLMKRPADLHVDPLQRHVEIDHFRFDCSKEGAQRLEDFLNAKYAPSLDETGENSIEVRDNAASATGFDIHFVTNTAGFRNEIKGHLNQEKLDILQDSSKCDILRPGVLLRFVPPHLLIRMRRSDGGEEHIPELPDIEYRHITAMELQRVLNHPLIRKTKGPGSAALPLIQSAVQLESIKVVKDPLNLTTLWLECISKQGDVLERKAFTHHNVLEMAHHGIFSDEYDVSVSVDNRTLTIANKITHQTKSLTVRPDSNEEHLKEAGQWLTATLKHKDIQLPQAIVEAPKNPIENLTAQSSSSETETQKRMEEAKTHEQQTPQALSSEIALQTVNIPKTSISASPKEKVDPPITAAENHPTPNLPDLEPVHPMPIHPAPNPIILDAFKNLNSRDVILGVFGQLQDHMDLTPQTFYLSMPRIFENRQFDVLNMYQTEIESVMDLRNESFCGFYLSHINEEKIILVYACQGIHIEWGQTRCLVETSITAEPEEFSGAGLLGLAVNKEGHCVFIVQSAYRQWIKHVEKHFHAINIHFMTVDELAIKCAELDLLWPVIENNPEN